MEQIHEYDLDRCRELDNAYLPTERNMKAIVGKINEIVDKINEIMPETN